MSWGGWENLGGVILEAPSCTAWGPNRIDCFARGTNLAMFHRWFASGVSRNLTVSRHSSVTLSNADVDNILALASTVLQTNDGSGDVACGVTLARSGYVGVFNNTDGSLDTANELSTVFGLPGNVKVVADVNWCANQFNTSYIGCGQTPGTSFITERFTSSLEGILWSHEFGHNQGLQHRDTSTDNVMYFSIGSNRQRINQTECNAFTGSSGLGAESGMTLPMPDAASVAPTDSMRTDAATPEVSPADAVAGGSQMVLAQMQAGEAMSPDMAVEPVEGTLMPGEAQSTMAQATVEPANAENVADFVRQIYFDGLPLDRAAEFGPEAIPVLLDILNNPEEALYHENAALTLGMIGDAAAVQPMIDYLQSGGAGDAGREAFKGRVGAIIGLGYLANLAQSDLALRYLIAGVRPQEWESNGTIAATDATTPDQPRKLAEYAVLALGLCGREEGASTVKDLLNTQADLAPADNVLAGPEGRDVVLQSLQLFDQVTDQGLVQYYRGAGEN